MKKIGLSNISCGITAFALTIEPLFFLKRLEELKQLYSEKKERYKSIGFVNDMRNHLEDLKHKMAWAVVNVSLKYVSSYKTYLFPIC